MCSPDLKSTFCEEWYFFYFRGCVCISVCNGKRRGNVRVHHIRSSVQSHSQNRLHQLYILPHHDYASRSFHLITVSHIFLLLNSARIFISYMYSALYRQWRVAVEEIPKMGHRYLRKKIQTHLVHFILLLQQVLWELELGVSHPVNKLGAIIAASLEQ